MIVIFLFNFQVNRGYPPSIREIGNSSGISSTSVVNYYLDKLAADGYIQRDERVSRGTFLLPLGQSWALALLGIKPGTHCDICGAPLGGDGKYQPRVPTKIQKKNRHGVYQTAA